MKRDSVKIRVALPAADPPDNANLGSFRSIFIEDASRFARSLHP
jgi:hypothetical protein